MSTGLLGKQAVVIGASITGLMAARVAADFFEQVIILERDWLGSDNAVHRSVPQGHHPHGLLRGGFEVMSSLYDGFGSYLEQQGAVRVRAGAAVAYYGSQGKSFSASHMQLEPDDFGFDIYSQSRGALEFCLREKTLSYDNIWLYPETMVTGIIVKNGCTQGVKTIVGERIKIYPADLVINACGRANRVVSWLSEAGYPAPEKTVFPVDIGYASARYQIPDGYQDDVLIHIVRDADEKLIRSGIISTIENNEWCVSLIGRFGDYPQVTDDGFLAFAQSLSSRKLYELISSATRIGKVVRYRYPESVRYHYELLTNYPEGFLVLGDAACCFNPVYGQGMSAAALQVELLQKELTDYRETGKGVDKIVGSYYPRVSELIDIPWNLAAISDMGRPQAGVQPSKKMAALAECLG